MKERYRAFPWRDKKIFSFSAKRDSGSVKEAEGRNTGKFAEVDMKIGLQTVYAWSENVVAREIEGELILVPLVSGIGDLEDEIYTLNETGKLIWARLNGSRSLKHISEELALEYEALPGVIEKDVAGLVEELLKRGMLVEVAKG